MLVHTDDCDVIGECKADLTYIAQKFDERFGIKIVDEDYMLGVKRTISTNSDGVRCVELTQTDYIETLYREYEEHVKGSKTPETPFPESAFLSMAHPDGSPCATPETEYKSILKMGYQSVVGSLLWASRNCYPETACGVNLLCRVESCHDQPVKHGIVLYIWYDIYMVNDTGVSCIELMEIQYLYATMIVATKVTTVIVNANMDTSSCYTEGQLYGARRSIHMSVSARHTMNTWH